MANKRKPMKKILDLAKYIERGLNNSEISEILKTDRKTIRRYRKKFEESNSSHEILKNLSEDEAYLRISGSSNTRVDDERISKLNFEHLRKELKKKSVTLQLLWEEYINMHPTGYQYTQFCKHYRDYQKKENYSYTKNYKWGETFLVDYAGQKIPIHDPTDESIGYAHLFVGCLGASNYTYVEATMKETTRDWVDCHINAFEYFDGVPMSVVPDNAKALVTKANAYEPVINEVYKEMADHYDVVVLPTRVRKPKDKAKVEKEVQNAERWIIAKLRNRTFFSLDELNEAIWFLLVDYNSRPFQKRENSRVLEFEQYEKDALRPLPSTRFEFYEKKTASVYIDYHVEVDKKYYSVPCHLVGEKMEVLKLKGAKEAYEEQQSTPGYRKMSFEERLVFLFEREIVNRENARRKSRLRRAQLRDRATFEELSFSTSRGLDKQQIMSLSHMDWLKQYQNIIITGQTGVGKTYLACAFGEKACRLGYTTLYARFSRLADRLFSSRSDNTLQKELERIAKVDLLVIDDFGMEALTEMQRSDLMEIIEDRYQKKSTIISTQLPIKNWFDTIGDKTIADAILDRISHNAHKLKVTGKSFREKYKVG